MPRRERPLESADEPVARFANELRQLRDKAGGPTYRELSGIAHYSAATLSEAAGGRKLPTLAVTLAYVRACGGDTAEWEARWRELAVEEEPPSGGSPYVGLAPFQEQDADRFFGRERLIGELLDAVAARRFVGVFGASGSGKSSVLRAGLVPRLGVPSLVCTPGAHPLEELAVALARLIGESAVAVRAELEADPTHLDLRIRQWNPELVLVIDQFEEVFTMCAPDERRAFIKAITCGPRVVISVRGDFFGHCGRHIELVDAMRGGQVLVGPMTPDELRSAITEPAARHGAKVETALVARLVADVAGQPAALPLVSHALAETWRRRRGMVLTLNGYEAVGGIEHAVARTAEQVFGELTPDEQRLARQVFLRLIALGEGTEDTKRRVRRLEFDKDGGLLDRLASARLISLSQDAVELTHEALIRSWPRLCDWIDEDREKLRLHRGLIDATGAWEADGRDPDLLYRGARLAQARERLGDDLTGREREFLDASVALDVQRQTAARRRTRRLKQLVAVLSVLTLLCAGTATYAVVSERARTAERNTALALRAATEATALVGSDSRTALRMAAAARSLASTQETAEALISTNAASHQLSLTGPDEHLSTVEISPRADVAVTLGSYGKGKRRAGLWRLSGHEPTRTAELDFDYGWLEISADSRVMVVLVGDESTFQTQVWNIADLDRPRKVATLPSPHVPTQLSDDGRFLLAEEVRPPASRRGMFASTGVFRLWDLADLRVVALPPDSDSWPSLGPSGRELATTRMVNGKPAGVVDFWRLENDFRWSLTRSWKVGDWSPQPQLRAGGRFVNLSDEHRTRAGIWRMHGDREPEKWAELPVDHQNQTFVYVPGDGRYYFADTTGVLRVWDLEQRERPRLVATLRGHSSVSELRQRSDREFLLYDSRMGLWQLDLDVDRVMAKLCREGGFELSAQEWERHFPGARQRPLCPSGNL